MNMCYCFSRRRNRFSAVPPPVSSQAQKRNSRQATGKKTISSRDSLNFPKQKSFDKKTTLSLVQGRDNARDMDGPLMPCPKKNKRSSIKHHHTTANFRLSFPILSIKVAKFERWLKGKSGSNIVCSFKGC